MGKSMTNRSLHRKNGKHESRVELLYSCLKNVSFFCIYWPNQNTSIDQAHLVKIARHVCLFF